MDERESSSAPPGNSAREARTGLFTFLFLLGLGSAGLYSFIVAEHEANHRFVLVAVLLAAPAPAAILTRLWREEGFSDVSFRVFWNTGGTPLILAWLLPIVIGSVAYGVAWGSGRAIFAAPSVEGVSVAYVGSGPAARFSVLLLVSITLGATIYLPLALGTELGWRGYALPRLVGSRLPRPVLLSGLLWSAWQLPLVLTGDLAPNSHPAATVALFVVVLIAFSYLAAWLRFTSGSIWPPVIFSASWNATVGGAFAAATRGQSAWVGEAGIDVALATTLVALIVAWRRWPIRHVPEDASPTIARLISY
jgi:membrane protease YdiL (CAAX protease family)